MTALHANPDGPTVVVNNQVLYIDRFIETDPTVVDTISQAGDGVAELHRLLTLGAQVDKLASTTLDIEVLNTTVDRVTGTLGSAVDEAVQGLASSTQQLLDPTTGALPTALRTFSAGFEALLGSHFDPDSRKSILGKFEVLMTKVAHEQAVQISRMLDTNAPDSPLNRMRDEVTKNLKAETGVVTAQLRDLGERFAAQEAAVAVRREMTNKTTAKGFTFEDVVHELVAPLAAIHQDSAVQTGHDKGCDGTQRGDEVISLNPDDTRGHEANIVLECKDRKLSLKKILEELDEAMSNRNASVGIAVFAGPDLAPSPVPFSPYGNKAVLVLDKDDPDPHAIRLAYMWARWMARRELAGADTLDAARIEALIDEARRALQHATQVKRAHTSARKGIDDAASHVDTLIAEVTSALDGLATEVAKAA